MTDNNEQFKEVHDGVWQSAKCRRCGVHVPPVIGARANVLALLGLSNDANHPVISERLRSALTTEGPIKDRIFEYVWTAPGEDITSSLYEVFPELFDEHGEWKE